MSLGKQFGAIANLGVQFWLHMFKKPFVTRKSRGIERYRRNYKADHLASFATEEYNRFVFYDRCINCGLCDAACVQARLAGLGLWKADGLQSDQSLHFQPSLIPVDISRSQPLYHHGIALALMFAQCSECKKCELACPNGVPILEMARLVVERSSAPERSVTKCA
jgi:formate hydrogenlyase subunit 6/NADH:ubiquinone oxidoreductase subunit I